MVNVKPVEMGKTTRMSFARINEVLKMPNLIEVQKNSYEWFVRELKHRGYTSYEDILLATYANNTLNIYTKNENVKALDSFE